MKTIECQVIAGSHNVPAAVLGPRTLCVEDGWWVLDIEEVEGWAWVASHLLSLQAVFDPVLSKRWGRLVACRRAFSEAWVALDGEPQGVTVARIVS